MKLYREVKASERLPQSEINYNVQYAISNGWLEPIEITEEEVEDLYNKHLTTVNTGIHMEDQMLLSNFKAALKEIKGE